MDPGTLARWEKAIDPNVRIVLVTAVADKHVAKEAPKADADRYTTKPVDLGYFETVVFVKEMRLG